MVLSCASIEMDACVLEAVENIICYKFQNRKLLEEALTHSSFTNVVSYERLELIGDSILNHAISNHLFSAYPTLNPSQFSLLRAANINTEKLARVAIRHGLHRFIRHNSHSLTLQVQGFVDTVAKEDHLVIYGGLVKAPKVLADIIESVVGAIYTDMDFDQKKLWVVIRGLFEPILAPDDLKQHPHPVSKLFEICQKRWKKIEIKHNRDGDKTTASVFFDGEFVASASSHHKAIARLEVAKIALHKLAHLVPLTNTKLQFSTDKDGNLVVGASKQKLHELCVMKKWPKPMYRIEKDLGPSHKKSFVCSVKIATTDGILEMSGDEKSRVKDAEKSAASFMIRALHKSSYI